MTKIRANRWTVVHPSADHVDADDDDDPRQRTSDHYLSNFQPPLIHQRGPAADTLTRDGPLHRNQLSATIHFLETKTIQNQN